MNIKVCGVTTMKQLQQLDGLDVDFAGLIFNKSSSRYAGQKISKKEIKDADLDIKTVGVFVNAGYEEIMETVEVYGLDLVQLHGDESPHLCEEVSAKIEVIKGFHIGNESAKPVDFMLKDYDEVCDYYLFDAASKKNEGNAETFDWKRIAGSKIEKPFFLGGGVGPGDASAIKKFMHPDFYAVNLDNQFEKEAGVKDMALLLKFIHGLK